MSFTLRATGSAQKIDKDKVRQALSVLADPEYAIQLQASPYWAFKTFTDLELAAQWVVENSSAQGIYYAVNPVPRGLSDRVKNADPVKRRWLLVDCDRPKHPENADLSATDGEHEQARQLAKRISDRLGEAGWPEPLVVDSGNGFHLLYRLDLPNDAHVKALVQRVLKWIAKEFDGADGKVGAECHDARRIAKLPGTWACRGAEHPDRPHRRCEIEHCPDDLVPVRADLLQAIGEPDKKNGHAAVAKPGTFALSATASRRDAYCKRAIEGEKRRIALSTPGENRNISLNRAAFSLGQLVGGGAILEAEVECQLHFEAVQKGLSDQEARSTIRSGLEAGKKQPRGVPEDPAEKLAREAAESVAKMPSLIRWAIDIKQKSVSWLVPNRIARNFIAVMAGQTGLGKSFIVLDLVSRLTVGGEIPGGNGECFTPGKALIFSEDPHEQMLIPRLIELGADRSKVALVTWEAMGKFLLTDVSMMDRCYEEAGRPDLVVIDPPTNFLGDIDEHKNAEVRQVIMKIVAWLTEHNCACVFILHVNKNASKGVEALSRVMASVAWVTTARIAHLFCKDPNEPGRMLFACGKTNLGPIPKTLAYRIVSSNDCAKVEWLGEVDTTADEGMAGDRGTPRRILATDWLVGLFKEKLEWSSDEFWASAREHGVSRNAVAEARVLLDLPKPRMVWTQGGSKSWVWWVPEDWSHLGKSPGVEV